MRDRYQVRILKVNILGEMNQVMLVKALTSVVMRCVSSAS